MNCIFCCVFYEEGYLALFYLLLESIQKYGNLEDHTTHLLVYTSTPFMNKIKQSPFMNPHIVFEISDSIDTIDKACKSRLDLFQLPSVTQFNYSKILYLDVDILVRGDLQRIFDVCEQEVVYAKEEGVIWGDYWGGVSYFGKELELYEDQSAFSTGILLFKNCQAVRDLFCHIHQHIKENPSHFVDQAHFVYTAFKYSMYNNKELNHLIGDMEDIRNIKDIRDIKDIKEKVLYHFHGDLGSPEKKLLLMHTFLKDRGL